MQITKELMEIILYIAGFMGLLCALAVGIPLLKPWTKEEPCQRNKPKKW